ncbi:MAG: diaminobutyrate--2-oxoglutarate transaminase [Pirellulales bacterium]
MAEIIDRLESNVRNYARLFPTVFKTALGSRIFDEDGREFIDFFCGAGTVNYGHNCPDVNAAIVDYINSNGIQSSVDMATSSKVQFLEKFEQTILAPRDLDYRVQFPGPTGSSAVEAAIKLARKQTGRSHIAAFTGACHGHTLGSLTLTSNRVVQSEFYGSQNNVTHLPYENYWPGADSSELLEKMLDDNGSGIPKPAAVILETVQVVGGINVASTKWLRRVAQTCQQRDTRLIVDDVQVGCGRTGQFFSFEQAGIRPDMICLSKSIGGGLPMSMVLIRKELDSWKPGEHASSFRGNNLAFVAGRAVLDNWDNPSFELEVLQRGTRVKSVLEEIAAAATDFKMSVRGRGLIWGLDVGSSLIAKEVTELAFRRGLLLSAVGNSQQVIRCLPALNIPLELLAHGLELLKNCVNDVLQFRRCIARNESGVSGLDLVCDEQLSPPVCAAPTATGKEAVCRP